MARINTDLPSSGKPIQIFIPPATNSGFVNTSWFTILEAPDFSVPGTGDTGATPDPLDSSRELRPGEVFLETPLAVSNTTSTSHSVEVQVVLQGGSTTVPLIIPTLVPAGETIYLPIQGLRLLKTNFAAANGDRIQIRSSNAASLKIFGSASELGAADHAPDTD
jgi:hypothetical protein